MAQTKLNIEGGKPDSVFSFVIREEFETTGNRFISFNDVTKILLFDEVQDGNMHKYKVTISSPGCISGTQIIPFQCTDTGACETVRGGKILGSSKVSIGTPQNYSVVNLAGTTPYTYSWASTGGVLSSNSGANTTITFSQVGTYTLTVTISNCGNNPINLTQTIEVVLETCDKTNNTCFFYGMNGQVVYNTYNIAAQQACIGAPTYRLGSFSNGINVGSTVYRTTDSGSCTRLLPGYYPVKVSTNGCSVNSSPEVLITGIIQIDSNGKIISIQNSDCAVNFNVSSVTQPLCIGNSLSNASVTVSDIKNADRYIYCEGSPYSCTSTDANGNVSGDVASISIPPASPGQSKVYTLRLFNAANPLNYKDQTVIVTSPTGCAEKSPSPTITNAYYRPVTGGPSYTTTFLGSSTCAGSLKLYKLNTTTQAYELIHTQNVSGTWEVTPLIQYINGPGEVFYATIKCSGYEIESDPSNSITSVVAP